MQLVALGVQERLGEVLFKINTSCRIGQARRALETCSGFKERMPTVARLRATVGYMAEVEAQTTAIFSSTTTLVGAAAKRCQGFCRSELEGCFRFRRRNAGYAVGALLPDGRRCAHRVIHLEGTDH